jgi:CHC2 zinc finger
LKQLKAKSPMGATTGPDASLGAKQLNITTISFNRSEVAAYYRTRHRGLLQRGPNWRGVCVLHGGKRNSLSVEAATGRWKCFSDCGRGGSMIDFEIGLTGANFKTALAEIYAIVGRSLETGGDWRERQERQRTEKQEGKDASFFAAAALILLEAELNQLEPDAPERNYWTQILAILRTDPLALYRICKANDPHSAAGWVRAGVLHHDRSRWLLKSYVDSLGREQRHLAA